MLKRRGIRLLALALSPFLASTPLRAAAPVYTEAPRFYEFLPNAFLDVPDFFERADPRDEWPTYLGVLGTTALLIKYDQPILDESQRYARRVRLITPDDDGTRSRLVWTRNIGGVDADLRLPKGLNSAMYFVGDGLTSLAIVGGLAAFGGIANDYRALNTASQVMEGLVLTGMFVITSKYTFGRESPNQSTAPGGVWRPMPGFKRYITNISKYDAYPSGHVATALTTVTILADNYPEKTWIQPVGYTSISMLMFAMLNNGVHWAGDYPLGLAIGYVSAKTVFSKRKPAGYEPHATHSSRDASVKISPAILPEGLGVSLALDLPRYGIGGGR